MTPRTRIVLSITCAAFCGGTRSLGAQLPASISVAPLALIGDEDEERRRIGELLGDSAGVHRAVAATSTLMGASPAYQRQGVTVLGPHVRAAYNSAIPFSLNEGSLWAGRGTNVIATVGLVANWRRAHVILAPQVFASGNAPFQVIPYPDYGPGPRSQWANPFHPPPSSIDLPLRQGDEPLRGADFGQSSVTLDFARVATGVATENEWWGPGIRNAIVLSDNAPGFIHLFARTRNGLRTRVGTFDAEWLLGRLRESPFFDTDPANDPRSLSGMIVSWTSPVDSGLTLGLARTVMARSARDGVPLAAAFDVLRDIGRPNTVPSDTANGGRDQVAALFGRWVFPGAGFEVYGEWARFEQPASLRDLLEFPGHSQGYTVGLQWARRGTMGTLRLQAEATYLEPDPSLRVRPVATTYTSAVIPQGYTNRGMVLGAATGPGSSSQYLAADLFAARFRAGVFLGRIRWDNGVLWTPLVPEKKNEDVSVFGGVQASVSVAGVRAEARYTNTLRLDYLFQDRIEDPAKGTHAGVDIRNRSLSFVLSTAIAR